MVITWARVLCLICMPEGRRPEGIHIRQSTSAHVITTMLHFLSKLTQQLKLRNRSICGDCIYSAACEFRL